MFYLVVIALIFAMAEYLSNLKTFLEKGNFVDQIPKSFIGLLILF